MSRVAALLAGQAVKTSQKFRLYPSGGCLQIPMADDIRPQGNGVCQGSCRVSHFLSGLFILSLRVQIYRPDGCPIACAA